MIDEKLIKSILHDHPEWIDIVELRRYRDGGTVGFFIRAGITDFEVFIDNRINSKTKGVLFGGSYPDYDDSFILSPVAAKNFWTALARYKEKLKDTIFYIENYCERKS